jgi:hypothetical protein
MERFMRSAALVLLGLLVTGCATIPTVDAPTALNGRELDTALSLYGRWDEKIVLSGRQHYVWRRGVTMNGRTYFCELRSEVGYRNVISSTVVEGYPAACSLFNVQYSTATDARPREDAPRTQVLATRERNFRPVGAPQETASAAQAAEDAVELPRAAAAGRRGS